MLSANAPSREGLEQSVGINRILPVKMWRTVVAVAEITVPLDTTAPIGFFDSESAEVM